MKKAPAAGQITTLTPRRPSRSEAEDAVRTLIAWSGDNPARKELERTPERVVDAFHEYFSGYGADASEQLTGTFDGPAAYTEMVLLKDIAFESHCEHHIAPFFGVAHVAYLPEGRIVGLSRIARIVDIFARRLQTQERLTCEIAGAIQSGLNARGVAVMMRARHHCMAARGPHQPNVATVTYHFTGEFERDAALRERFLSTLRD